MTKKNKNKKTETGVWHRVEIDWIDSTSVRVGGKTWHPYQEVEDVMESAECLVTSGYKFGENKEYVMVAMSMTVQDGQPVLFGDPMLIPKGCIKQIRKL